MSTVLTGPDDLDHPADEPVAGRYEVGPVIGHGGSATVHRAWDRVCERPVALKRYAAGATGPDRYRQDQELATLSRLTHPGLVALLDAGVDDDRPYLVMQLVDGPSLTERLADGPLAVPDVVAIGRHLASALRYVHAQGITHRDVKPANVLLDGGRVPLLADFGIALLVDTTRVTTTEAVVGTAAYMAPEQLRGDDVGPPADVYALGLVMLEAITGRRAYPGTSTEAVVARLHHGPAVPPDLPGGCSPLLARMTAFDPAERPDARAVVGELARVCDRIADPDGDHPAPAEAPATGPATGPAAVPPGIRSRITARRPSRRALAVVAVAVMTAIGGVVGALTLGAAAPAARPSPLPVTAPPAPRPPVAVGAPLVPASPPSVAPTADAPRPAPTGAPAADDGDDDAPSVTPRTVTDAPRNHDRHDDGSGSSASSSSGSGDHGSSGKSSSTSASSGTDSSDG